MLNSGHVELTVHNSVFLDIWWNMSIKFSKDPAKHLSWSYLQKSFLGLRGNLESCQTSKMELFAKIVKNEKPLTHYFCKNLHLGCLTRFWICFWIGLHSYECFIFRKIWTSEVTDNLLGKTKKKEPAELLN